MKYLIGVENGTGSMFFRKEDFMRKLQKMIEECWLNGATFFSVEVESDAQ